MRDRHLPRLCRSCHGPMARQEDTCWRCGTRWATEDQPTTILRLPVRPMPAVLAGDVAGAPSTASLDVGRRANDGGTNADHDGALLAARAGGRR
jgi:hypothetical protein